MPELPSLADSTEADPQAVAVPIAPPGYRVMLAKLIPGLFLPSIVYFAVAPHAPLLVALAAASSIPAVESVWRLARGRRPSTVGLGFLAFAAVSVSLAIWLKDPRLILGRGALTSAVLGLALFGSAVVRRPLTRTFALMLSTERREERRRLAERWGHPKVLSVFRVLAAAWGVLLLLSATQQAILMLTISPSLFMALEPPMQLFGTVVGFAASFLYVHRKQRTHPEVRLIPVRA